MANTTFNGPVRSENGFQTISINQSTGTVTVDATFGAATQVTSLAATGNVTADSASALVAGGASAFIATNTAAGMGMVYLRSDGSSTSTRLYVSDGGTTWIAVTTAS
jgi:hypothetical protein